MFQEGQKVRHVRTGEVYTVEWVRLNAALLTSPNGSQFILDGSQRLELPRTDEADRWDPVPA